MFSFGTTFFKIKELFLCFCFIIPKTNWQLTVYKPFTEQRKFFVSDFFSFFQHPHLDKRYKYCQNRGMTQLRLMQSINAGINGLWFFNHKSISWSHKPKICKTCIFQELFFPKYDNFKIINTANICLSICQELNEWDWSMKENNSIECLSNYVVIH